MVLPPAVRRVVEKKQIWRPTLWVAAGFGLLLGLMVVVWPTDLVLSPLNSWNIFHYTLGTKYFDELGYFDFYEGVLLADADGDKVWRSSDSTRDLNTYRSISVGKALKNARQKTRATDC